MPKEFEMRTSALSADVRPGGADETWAPLDPAVVEWPYCDGEITVAYVEPGYRADDGYAELHYEDAASSRAAAEAYTSAYEPIHETYWARVHVWRRAVGVSDAGALVYGRAHEELHRIAVHPVEPPCVDLEGHDWQSPHEVVGGCRQSPGIWGRGPGIIEREVCTRCGRYLETYTWAQDPETGEEGLRAIRYDDADEAALAWVEARAAREDD